MKMHGCGKCEGIIDVVVGWDSKKKIWLCDECLDEELTK